MCEYCDTSDYVGELMPFCKHIDGKRQNIEVYVFDNPEQEQHVLQINGDFTDIQIGIKFCPMCGKKL